MKKTGIFRAASVLLIASVVFTLFPAFPITVHAETEGAYTYEINNGEATITGVDKNIAGDVVIPDTLGGYPVVGINSGAFEGCSNLINISIPCSVTSIGFWAFEDCSSLTSISIPDGVSSIGTRTFYGCGSLTNVSIPDSVTSIGNDAFRDCSSLTSISMPDSVSSIGDYVFYGCSSLTSISIPDSVTSIGNSAFSGCSGLTSISIPNGVTSIGDYVFYDCSGLTSVSIPNSVTSIGEAAFSNCSGLTDIQIPDSITSIDYRAFSSCSSLTSISIPDSVTSIDMEAFSACSGLTSISIPNSITSIGERTFMGCSSLTSITIPDSVTSIDRGAFGNCDGLISIHLPAGIEHIGNGAFGESKLTDIYYDGSLTTLLDIYIGQNNNNLSDAKLHCSDGVFLKWETYSDDVIWRLNDEGTLVISGTGAARAPSYNSNMNIKSVIIEDGITAIDGFAFNNYYDLTSISIPDSVTSIGDMAFYNCSNLTSISIPDSVTSIGEQVFDGTKYYNDQNNWIDGVLYVGNHLVEGYANSSTVKIKDGTKVIADYAFCDCWITSISIPDSVTSIGDMAFYNCRNLTSISIPDSVTSIGEQVFDGTKYYNDQNNWIDGVLYVGNHLVEAKEDQVVSDLTIKKGTKSIGDNALSGCNDLTSVSIPDSVVSIGNGAFSNCNNINSVYILDLEAYLNIDFKSNRSNPMCFASQLYLNNELIQSIEIPNSVTGIPDYAFSGCKSLISVNIPDSVISIGDGAFSGCSGLTSITIPDSVTSIGDDAFVGCDSITEVYYNGSLFDFSQCIGNNKNTLSTAKLHCLEGVFEKWGQYGDNVIWCMDDSGLLIICGTGSVENSSPFYSDESIKSIIIENGVTSIGNDAFSGCSSLTSISIPDSVTSIGDGAFSGCSNLTSITIPDSVTSIGDDAFRDCSSLTSISMPDSVTYIGDYAFSACSSLTSISIPNSVIRIGDSAFSGCSSLTSISIPDSVISIGNSAFFGCSNLTSINISSGITKIENHVFRDCYMLNNIVIPDSVTYIGDYAFSACSSLTSISIPESVTRIGYRAFLSCNGLNSISIPDSVTWIDSCAFSNCSNLESVTISKGLKRIDNELFSMCKSLTSISIPDSVTSIGDSAFEDCSNLTSISIPDSVRWIGDGVFSGCSSLTNFSIPNSVIRIGDSTFRDCSNLTSISIPDSVRLIGDYAFSGCSSLASISIPDNVTWIGYSAFSYCNNLTSITIPYGVKSMNDYVFSYCNNLLNIDIPNSLISVGENILLRCSKLTDIYYTGTEDQWKQMSMNRPLASENVMIHYEARSVSNMRVLSLDEETVTLLFSRPVRAEAVVLEQSVDNGLTWMTATTAEPISSHSVTAVITGLEIGTTYYFRLNVTGGSYPGFSNICKYVALQYTPENEFEFYNGEITRYNGDDTQVIIPPVIQNLPVSSLGGAFSGCSSLTSISIPDSVTSIGDRAFKDCSNLTSISIPDSVVNIGGGAFDDCSSLKSIMFPDGLLSIGSFSNCSSLTTVTIPDSVTSINYKAFAGCSSLTSVNIGAGVTSIAQYAFSSCDSLKNIRIPESVVTIEDYAFVSCDNLKDVYYEGSENAWNLIEKGIDIFPEGVTIHYNAGNIGPIYNLSAASIADHAVALRFSEPQGAESIVLEQSEDGQNWHDSVIYGTLTPSSVTVAVTGLKPRTDYQFRLRVMGGKREGVSNIAQITTDSADMYSLISEGCITKVLGSPIVSSVARGESVYSIADEVYQGKGIEFIALPESLRTIGKRTFADCENLAAAFLPSSLKSIGDEAFAGCGNLMDVYYNGTETQWEGIEKGNDAIPEQATVHFIENSLPISDFTACASTNCTATFSFSPAINAEEVVLEQSTDGTTWTAAKTDRPMAYDTSVVVAEDLDMQTSYSFRLRVTGGIRDGISNEATITTTGYTAEEDFQFTNGTITKYIGTAESVSIPPTIGGEKVNVIGEGAFENCHQLRSVAIPQSVTIIDMWAFCGCIRLLSIQMSDDLLGVAYGAFLRCESLTYVELPEGTKEIGRSAFQQSGLQSLTLPNSIAQIYDRAVYGTGLNDIYYNGTQDEWNKIYIEQGLDGFKDPITGNNLAGDANALFYFAKKHYNSYTPETDFIFENGVITGYTGNEAVVTIPHSINQQIVTKIGDNVFAGNTTITEVTIPSTVEAIGNKTFSGCTNLTSVSSNVTEIGDYAFENCEKLKDIELPKTLSYLGTGAFAGCAQLSKILLADRITEIKNDTFSGCSSLTELNISDSVTSIGRNAFSGCKVNIYFDGTMEEWDVLTENANIAVGEVNVIPYDKSLFVVWDTGLLKNYSGTSETVVIPPVINGTLVTGISQGIFDGRYSIKEVFIPNTVTNIYDGTFSGCKGLTSVTIPEGVTSIGAYAFYGCSSLTSISIPDSVTSIGDGAFSGIAYYEDDSNWMDNVLYIDNFLIEARSELSGECEIKNGTKVIADNAFHHCPLTKVTVPNSVTHIGNSAFNNCWALTNMIIPSSVISIGDHAFVGCMGMTSITIPASVTNIGDGAFYNCANLKDVYYGGTERQWNEISRNADVGESVIIHFLGTESMPVDDLKVERVSNQTVSLSFSTPVGADAITIEQSDNGVNWSTAATEQPVTPLSSKAVVMNLQPNTTYYFRLQVTGGSNAGVSNVVSTMTSELAPSEEYVFVNGIITGYTGTDTEISIPDEINGIPVTAIGAGAFASSNLVSVVIPDTVISIETEAFSGCEDLTHVILPDSLTSIAEKAFAGCSKLTSIAYNGTPEEWGTLVAQNADAELESMMVEYIPNVKTVAVKEGNQTIFEVSAKNVPESSTIILALYKDNRLIEIQKAVYENQKMTFTATVEYDIAKVMAWGDLNNMTPVCEPDVVWKQK